MPQAVTKIFVLAALLAPLSVPVPASAQSNSIMQSFHPEKFPAAKTEAGKQTEPDHPKDAEAKPSTEKPAPEAEAK